MKLIREFRNMEWTCKDCQFLDKKNFKKEHDFIRYKCNKNGYVPMGVRIDEENKDKYLAIGGCSDFKEKEKIEQLDLFCFLKEL